jgi:hypothetical protein
MQTVQTRFRHNALFPSRTAPQSTWPHGIHALSISGSRHRHALKTATQKPSRR